MTVVMKKMIPRVEDYGSRVVLLNVCGVGSESWVIYDDVIWFLSGEAFAVDTFVLGK